MYTHIANISHFIRHIIHSLGIHDLVQVAYDQNLALLGSAGLTPVAERFELRKQQMLGTTCGTRINGSFPEHLPCELQDSLVFSLFGETTIGVSFFWASCKVMRLIESGLPMDLQMLQFLMLNLKTVELLPCPLQSVYGLT